MSNCPHCNTSLNPSARFCKNCGKPAHPAGDASQTQSAVTSISGTTRVALNATLFICAHHFTNSLRTSLEGKGIRPLGIISDADTVRIQQKARMALQTQRAKGLKYVCLIGDWDEVPPFVVPAPEGINDGDEFCRTDALYGCISDYDSEDIFTAIPDYPVGRIPSTNIDVVCATLMQSTELVDSEKLFLFGVSAYQWNEATETIVSKFLSSVDGAELIQEPESVSDIPTASILSSPDWCEEDLRGRVQKSASTPHGIILFNVHGGADEPYWVGERDGEYPKIFEPGTVNSFNASTIVCEACYGGALGYDEPSVVEHFFANGGHTFVGSSTIAYGSRYSSISAADYIALYFLEALGQGKTTGEALNYAKLEAVTEDPLYDFIGQKTVLSFNLFGAPWHFRKKTRAIQTVRESTAPNGASLLDQIRNRRSPLINNSNSPLDAIREQYRARLPERNKQFLLEKAEALKTIRGFKDFDLIDSQVSEWGGDMDDAILSFLSNENDSGYSLISEALGFKNAKKIMILLIDAQGNLKKTLTSKGI